MYLHRALSRFYPGTAWVIYVDTLHRPGVERRARQSFQGLTERFCNILKFFLKKSRVGSRSGHRSKCGVSTFGDAAFSSSWHKLGQSTHKGMVKVLHGIRLTLSKGQDQVTKGQGHRNYFEVGGQGLRGFKMYPTQNTKKLPGLAHYFLGEAQLHVKKPTKIKNNDIDSPKLGGRRIHSFQVGEQAAPTAPPPPLGSRVSVKGHDNQTSKVIFEYCDTCF